jgi:DNA adenine methylase
MANIVDLKTKPRVTPFLKWPGGKRWLAERCIEAFPEQFNTYYEPFLGGGAVFFRLRPSNAVLSDSNRELMATYRALTKHHKDIATRIRELHASHSADIYYDIRSENPSKIIDIATRFIYLNRTCWNGLYRVNRQGKFNVPIGNKTSVVLETDDWESVASALRKAELVVSDFEAIINRAGKDDLVFADPPYTVKHNNNGFIKYNETIFAWADQVRLRDALLRAQGRGAWIFCTNADHQSIRDLYSEYFKITQVDRSSVLSGVGSKRGPTTELLIQNY